MPTERFNKLPEEKKKAIRDAAMEECIRVPFEKVSINKIIQNAGISRGSFYTYFEDKRDVVRYIFSDTADKLKDFWTTSATEATYGLLQRSFWIRPLHLPKKGRHSRCCRALCSTRTSINCFLRSTAAIIWEKKRGMRYWQRFTR